MCCGGVIAEAIAGRLALSWMSMKPKADEASAGQPNSASTAESGLPRERAGQEWLVGCGTPLHCCHPGMSWSGVHTSQHLNTPPTTTTAYAPPTAHTHRACVQFLFALFIRPGGCLPLSCLDM